MKFSKRSSILIGIALAVGSIGLWYYFHNRHEVSYQTAAIERGQIQASISATGTCNAVVSVQVGSQVSGNIKALYADFNTKVKMGQVVALIDPQAFQARVDQAKATLDSARAAAISAQAQIEKAKTDIASAQAAVANQKAAIAKAKAAALDAGIKLKSRQVLFEQRIISKDDMDTAKSTYDQATAEEQAAEAELDAANHQVQSSEALYELAKTQFVSAQAQVKQNEAALEQANLDLDHTRITAPVDGTVIARNMDVGQTVAASFQAPTIFQIAQDLTKMQVDTNVDEADVGQVRLGQKVNFTVDAYPTNPFHGFVQQIRQAPINVQNVITYDVVVAVANQDLKLLPGMTANVRILTGKDDDALKIPNAALRFRPTDVQFQPHVHAAGKKTSDTTTVWVLEPGGEPKPIEVTLGITDGVFTAADSGNLKPGDRVIVSRVAKVSSGAPLQRTPQGPRF